MRVWTLLLKELRQHCYPLLFLTLGSLVVFVMLFARNEAAAYSMSSFEIVRFSLLGIFPMLAVIVGNRLIVSEYMSGTYHFVEALPTGPLVQLLVKYLLGFTYLSIIAITLIYLAAQHSQVVDDVTVQYLALITAKTFVMLWLYWSVAFCFSLCGYLRVVLYLTTAAFIAFLLLNSGLNAEKFSPLALINDQLFTFERDHIPWADIAKTAALAIVFTVVGFLLMTVGEGGVVERLAKPMTRRDYVALTVLSATGLVIWSSVQQHGEMPTLEYTSEQVVRLVDPSIAVLYVNEENLDTAEHLAKRTSTSILALQAALGLETVPDVNISLDTGRDKYDIGYQGVNDLFINVNWKDYDTYDNAVLDTVVVHEVLSHQTNGRAVFEPYHWILDGFSRWWVENGVRGIRPEHSAELTARALWALDSDPLVSQLIGRWQLIADRYDYSTAEALAWSAMAFLEQTQGREKVLDLARIYFSKPVEINLVGSITDRLRNINALAEDIIGMPMSSFLSLWSEWLTSQGDRREVSELLSGIPLLTGIVVSEADSSFVYSLKASYVLSSSDLGLRRDIDSLDGSCVMKHDYIGPFDTEFSVSADYQDVSTCQTDSVAHVADSDYTYGDRVFVALDYQNGVLHQPLRLHAERLTIR